jgi:hypothetical protein
MGVPDAATAEPVMRLWSNDLLSMWGFNDGDTPDFWYFRCAGQYGIEPATKFPWVQIVRCFLLPALDQDVTVTELWTHNPIRAATVGGVDVAGLWDEDSRPVLTPEYVDVPVADIAAVVQAGIAASQPVRTADFPSPPNLSVGSRARRGANPRTSSRSAPPSQPAARARS